MAECCSSCSTNNKSKKYHCPVNGNKYKQVSIKTIQYHIKEPWNWSPKDQNYYFCDDPDCDVVYFGEDNSVFNIENLRISVGVKEKLDKFTICYCFGVSSKDAENDESIKDFVTKQTKNQVCNCEIMNPSGKCCLKNFPKS